VAYVAKLAIDRENDGTERMTTIEVGSLLGPIPDSERIFLWGESIDATALEIIPDAELTTYTDQANILRPLVAEYYLEGL
jgi:hypothetical protein